MINNVFIARIKKEHAKQIITLNMNKDVFVTMAAVELVKMA